MANVTIMGADYQNVNEIYLKDTDTGDELKFVLEVVPTSMIIIPEQTINASGTYNEIINFVEPLAIGEQYIYTVDGESHTAVARDLYGSVAIWADNTPWLFEYDRGMYFTVRDSSAYGSHVIKVEKVLSS